METATERWRITIPVTGFDFRIREKFQVQNATVQTLLNYEKKEEVMISVEVDDNLVNARKIGKALIDRIAARLAYSTGKEIRLREHIYATQLQPKTDKATRGWGYHDFRATGDVVFPMGDHYASMVFILRQLDNLKQEKHQDIIDKAVAYYREALAAKNPFQKIITLFSCIKVIVRDATQENNLQQYHICKILAEYAKLDTGECKDYYGAYRSSTDHGLKDIIDRAEMQQAETKADRLRLYTFSLIKEYVERKKKEQEKEQLNKS